MPLIILFLVTGIASGAFIAPAEGPVPFRRDKLPVDTDTMGSLSMQLVTLAEHTNGSDAASERAVAQMLALSLALDPSNRRALDLSDRLTGGMDPKPSDQRASQGAKNRAWNLLGWLTQPEAGADGRALGACLGDIMLKVDPSHPRAEELKKKGEQGAWAKWVAPLEDFQSDPTQDPGMVEPVEPDPKEIEPVASAAAEILLEDPTVRVPLWHFDKIQAKTILSKVPLKLHASVVPGSKELRVEFPGEKLEKMNRQVAGALGPLLEEKYGTLPEGLLFKVSMPEGIIYSFSRNGGVITGALMVMADAAFSGNEPTATVLVEVGEDGELKIPTRFWQTLRMLATQEDGTRLVLPLAAKEFLPPLVTLDQTEFFISHEVLLATDVNSLCALASSAPPERVALASQDFATIRKVRGNRSLGSFLNFASTQQRLNQIVAKVPEHSSARLLALRGTSKWPQRLPRPIYAREIRAAMLPMDVQMNKNRVDLKPSELDAAEDECRTKLEVVDKLEESVTDRQELQIPALNAAKLLGGVADTIKRNTDDRSKGEASAKAAYREYVRTLTTLTSAAGDTDDYPVPKLIE